MSIKALKEKKTRLEAAAQEKLTLITDQTPEAEARAIEAEHADLLAQIAAVDEQIRKTIDGDVDDESGDVSKKDRKTRKKRAKKDKTNDDVDDKDDDEEDDDEEEEEKDRSASEEEDSDKNEKGLKKPSRSMVAEMALIDQQARGLGIELDLPDAITRGEKPDGMRKRLFAELAKKAKKGPQGGGADMQITRDEREGIAAAMEIALITRVLASRGGEAIKYEPKNPVERARVDRYRKQSEQYLSMGLVDIAAACIDYRPSHSSRYLTAGDANTIFERAFNSTSDFPNIFLNMLNKSLLARYELHMPTYREISQERPFNDFRPHPQIRAGEFPQLQPISETGELKYGTTADTGEFVSVVPYGVVFTISRTMLVNDDLGAIDQILGSAGDTVLVFENTTFFQMLLSNSGTGPTLAQDTYNVFDTTHHANQAATGAVPSVSTIGTARQALRQMKSISGLYLNVPPRIILTGPAQETVADQMVTAITPTLTTSVNPFSGRLRSVSDANITDDSWYLFTEPGRVPCFIYGFLNGANGPRVRTFEPFGVQGVKISLEHDFGCGAIDYRGAYRSPVY